MPKKQLDAGCSISTGKHSCEICIYCKIVVYRTRILFGKTIKNDGEILLIEYIFRNKDL